MRASAPGILVLGTLVLACLVSGCNRGVPTELLGSYARSGDPPALLRAELSIARGGMVLTVVRLSASADLASFASVMKLEATVAGVLHLVSQNVWS